MQELVEEKNLTREEETRDCAMLGLIKPLPCQYQAPPCLYPHHLIKYKYRRSKQLISLIWYDLWQNYSAKAWCPILKVKFFVGTFWPSSPFTITITNRKDKWEKGKNYCYFVCCIWFNQGWGLNVRKTTKPSKLNKHDNRPNSLYYKHKYKYKYKYKPSLRTGSLKNWTPRGDFPTWISPFYRDSYRGSSWRMGAVSMVLCLSSSIDQDFGASLKCLKTGKNTINCWNTVNTAQTD